MTTTIVITGAWSGFGALSARALANAGHVVYAGMRDIDRHNATQAAEAKQYAAGHDVDLRPVELDMSSKRSVDEAVGTVISEQGIIDVLAKRRAHGDRSDRGLDSGRLALRGNRARVGRGANSFGANGRVGSEVRRT